MKNERTVRLVSLGCAKNSVDSDVMAGILNKAGYRVVTKGRADVGIVNTCGFIRDAKEESVDAILSLAKRKEKGAIRKVVLAGCLATRYRDDLPGLMPEVDLFVGPGEIVDLPRRLDALFAAEEAEGSAEVDRDQVGEGVLPDYAYRRRIDAGPIPPAVFLKILDGCDNRCSYCTIPMIRGPLKSRDADSVVAEAKALAARGAVELNVVGQDVTAYGNDRGESGALVRLVRRLCKIPHVRWIRLLYLYPSRVDDALIDLVASEEKVCKYLDIPIQHADEGILRKMGRPYGPVDVSALVDRLRDRIPGVALRTSLIVGFPGEGEKAFNRLLRFVDETPWEYLGAFAYSREEGTRAHGMSGHVSAAVKAERLRMISDAQADRLAERNRSLVGSTVEVLVEEVKGGGKAVGRHRGQAPDVDGLVMLSGFSGTAGDIVTTFVTGAREWDLRASVSRPNPD